MAKNIALSNKIYGDLLRNKRESESFSEEISRFMGKRGSISDLAGAWKMSSEESSEMKTRIRRLRRITTEKAMRRAR